MFVCVHMSLCMYRCVVHMYTPCSCVYSAPYICVCVFIYIYIYDASICVFVYICLHVRAYVWMRTYEHICAYANIHANMLICSFLDVCISLLPVQVPLASFLHPSWLQSFANVRTVWPLR